VNDRLGDIAGGASPRHALAARKTGISALHRGLDQRQSALPTGREPTMKRILVLAAILAMSAAPLAATNAATPQCKTGIPCGNTCIAKGKTCHIKPAALQCKTGVPCGNSCIAKGKKCTK
jgi:hypothetical protein